MYFNDNETAVDLLQYEPIAKSVVALVKSAGTSPISIGLHGDWGAGKSSVLAMVQSHLSGEKKILCLRFNGWAFGLAVYPCVADPLDARIPLTFTRP